MIASVTGGKAVTVRRVLTVITARTVCRARTPATASIARGVYTAGSVQTVRVSLDVQVQTVRVLQAVPEITAVWQDSTGITVRRARLAMVAQIARRVPWTSSGWRSTQLHSTSWS